MATQIYRVVIRGQFDHLTSEQRDALLAEANEHGIFQSAFTEWGTFTYDERLVAFNFRYEVRTRDDDEELIDPVQVGMNKALASLTEWGLGHKHMRGTAADLSQSWTE